MEEKLSATNAQECKVVMEEWFAYVYTHLFSSSTIVAY